jgi:MOSC domain-containing protein YiiM
MTVIAKGVVESVSLSQDHSFSKPTRECITLISGIGVAGDAHSGDKVKHRSRAAKDPHQPNLRQVHLIHGELHDELSDQGFRIWPGQMGENVTTRGIPLLLLPDGTKLRLGKDAIVQLTGLRNPCPQLDQFQAGLMAAVLERDADGRLVGKAGVMAIVLHGGEVRPGDPIAVELPPQPHRRLEKV